MDNPSNRFIARVALLSITALASAAALASPPATVATCDGIKAAYPILGTQCASSYININHEPENAADRLKTYTARKDVMQIFRKVLLCNGMYGAAGPAQQQFKSEEEGHLKALEDLHKSMIKNGDPKVPALYTASDLKSVSMTKQQCK